MKERKYKNWMEVSEKEKWYAYKIKKRKRERRKEGGKK